MAQQKQYSLKERAEYHAKLGQQGAINPTTGEKLSAAQRANHLYKAGKLQNKAERIAKNAEYYAKNQSGR